MFNYRGEWINPEGEKWILIGYGYDKGLDDTVDIAWLLGVYTELITQATASDEDFIRVYEPTVMSDEDFVRVYEATDMSDEDFVRVCAFGTLQEIEEAIKNGANVNARDENGLTALMRVTIPIIRRPGLPKDSLPKYTEVISVLFENGADVNAR